MIACESELHQASGSKDTLSTLLKSTSATLTIDEITLLRYRIASELSPKTYLLEVSVRYPYRTEKQRGTGWRSDQGVIYTCSHIFPQGGKLEIEAWGADGSCQEAQIVWIDSIADVALLRIKEGEKGGLKLRTDTLPRVGETVFAIGAPFGLLGTLSEGFVSAPLRFIEVGADRDTLPFLQLSLPAQPGSSGSPIVDQRGYVVGMISDIATLTDRYEGITFAIPAHVLNAVWLRYRSFVRNDSERTR
ncbi:MAG: S1C family serine protease [Bacteroidia bacterium]|nr:S1C family serine protease [Bacteroidia bacterium]MDW8014740.1 S1C family serine protease [Bacteroidia bacterium]